MTSKDENNATTEGMQDQYVVERISEFMSIPKNERPNIKRAKFSSKALTELPFATSKFEDFISLEYLSLSDNLLTSSIFDSLLSTTSIPRFLQTLDLSCNNISSIPEELQKNCKQLKHLYLHHCQFTTFPEELFNSETLQTLDLSSNQIKSLPPELFDSNLLLSLKSLILSYNLISQICLPPSSSAPPSSSSSASSTEVNCDQSIMENSFSNTNEETSLGPKKELKEEHEKLGKTKSQKKNASLEKMILNHNNMIMMDDNLFLHEPLARIKVFDCSHNQISKLPSSVFKLNQLETLDFSYNSINELYVEYSNQKKEEEEEAQIGLEEEKGKEVNEKEKNEDKKPEGDNNKSQTKLIKEENNTNDDDNGSIAEYVPIILPCSLKILNLSHNQITEIPEDCVAQLKHLRRLELSHNLFITKLPSIIFKNNREMEYIDLSGTSITSICKNKEYMMKLSNVKEIYFRECVNLPAVGIQDIGESHVMIPPEVFECKNLKILDLSGSSISTIQRDIVRLSKLDTLKMSNCPHLIEIPLEITTLSQLKCLELGNCPVLQKPCKSAVELGIASIFDDLRGTFQKPEEEKSSQQCSVM